MVMSDSSSNVGSFEEEMTHCQNQLSLHSKRTSHWSESTDINDIFHSFPSPTRQQPREYDRLFWGHGKQPHNGHFPRLLKLLLFAPSMNCRITPTKSPSFCMTTFSASLTNLTGLLHPPSDCSFNVSRRILAPPLLWLQKHTDQRALFSCVVGEGSLKLPAPRAADFVDLILP
jgi:hypothetical protein